MNTKMEKAIEKVLKAIKQNNDFKETPKITCSYLTSDKKDLSIAIFFYKGYDEDIVNRDYLLSNLNENADRQRFMCQRHGWSEIFTFVIDYDVLDELFINVFWREEDER